MSAVLDLNGTEVEVEYSATPFVKGYTAGAPEHCYPDEGGEIEITAVEYTTQGLAFIDGQWQRVFRVIVDVMPLLPDSEIERLQEEIAQTEEEATP